MSRLVARLLVVGSLLLGIGLAWAFSNAPPASRTGARGLGIYPAEPICTQCHSGNPLNDPNGLLQIDKVPPTYQANAQYTIDVSLAYSLADTTGPSDPKWGFQLSAIKATDGTGAGTLLTPNPGPSPGFPDSLRIVVPTGGAFFGSGRQYIEHSGFATRTNEPGPVVWHFDWKAPASDVGKIYFFAAGNAANGDLSNGGDHIFTAVDSIVFGPPVPATGGPSWIVLLGAGLVLTGGVVLLRRALAEATS